MPNAMHGDAPITIDRLPVQFLGSAGTASASQGRLHDHCRAGGIPGACGQDIAPCKHDALLSGSFHGSAF